MTAFEVSNVGQIETANVEFGDLTVLVGPQATGKSIFLQLFKLTLDGKAVKKAIKQYGFDWSQDWRRFLDLYLGEGMGGIWREQSAANLVGAPTGLDRLIHSGGTAPPESLFYIPAQRVLTLAAGWPRAFMDYGAADPFCLRSFSENLRQLMEKGLGSGPGAVFPQERRLKAGLRRSLDASVFNGASVHLDLDGFKKRLVLTVNGQKPRLPYMTWSAGQREFMPLLLGLYWLIPPTKISKKGKIDWVVVEEPEMGLHPQAIFTFMLLVLELIWRGYKVVLSTHSPSVLDVVWAIRELQEQGASIDRLRNLFSLGRWDPGMKGLFQTVLENKAFRTYLFEKDGAAVRSRDISTLDPGASEEAVAGWGGLSGFSGHAADVVAQAVEGGHG